MIPLQIIAGYFFGFYLLHIDQLYTKETSTVSKLILRFTALSFVFISGFAVG